MAAANEIKILTIDSGYFNAGAVLDETGLCVRAAPIIKYMKGLDEKRIREYCTKKGWTVSGGANDHNGS